PGESDVEFSVRAAVERIRWRAFEKQYSIVVINDQLSSESEMIVNRIAEQDDNIKFYDYGQLEEYLRNMRLKDK
ncbi:MAG: hypothetical protein Q4B04_06850, partial [bacterium]|nr:hypothetical protein [bacterium]